MYQVSNDDQEMYAREYIATNGPAAGMRFLELNNGVFHILVNLDRAMDIAQLHHKGMNISFISSHGINNQTGIFSERFEGGMLYTCGLDAVGQKDGHPQHGNFHLQKAELMSIENRDESLIIKGKIRQTSFFGEYLEVMRQITFPKNSNTVSIKDQITNKGDRVFNLQLLYHFNFGHPFFNEETEVVASSSGREGVDEYAQNNVATCHTFKEKYLPYEQVFYHYHNDGIIIIKSPKVQKIAKITYDNKVLPLLIEWKCLVKNHYALGIEPSNTRLKDTLDNIIEPGETKIYNLALEISDIK